MLFQSIDRLDVPRFSWSHPQVLDIGFGLCCGLGLTCMHGILHNKRTVLLFSMFRVIN